MLSLDMNRQGNSPLVIVVIVLVLAVAGAGFYLLQGNSTTESDLPTPSSAMQDDKMMDDNAMEEDAIMESGAKYVQYQKAGYEQIADSRHVLFFYANWCPTCRPVDTELQAEMDNLPLTVVRVNYNDSATDTDEEALADELGITYQHTFVLMENGEVVTRWNGGGLGEILSRI